MDRRAERKAVGGRGRQREAEEGQRKKVAILTNRLAVASNH